jgi:hypothetical protein
MSRAKKSATRKVVINACFGGFGLSPEALLLLWERGVKEIGTPVEGYWGDRPGWEADRNHDLDKWRRHLRNPDERSMLITVFSPDEKFVLYGGRDSLPRDHVELVKVVKELGKKANGACASLRIVTIPADVEWEIKEYDGSEHIAETHRTWS